MFFYHFYPVNLVNPVYFFSQAKFDLSRFSFFSCLSWSTVTLPAVWPRRRDKNWHPRAKACRSDNRTQSS